MHDLKGPQDRMPWLPVEIVILNKLYDGDGTADSARGARG